MIRSILQPNNIVTVYLLAVGRLLQGQFVAKDALIFYWFQLYNVYENRST